ncbi:MAG: hypothetical protein ABI873_16220, partial [Marmoricola sp.]
MFKTALRPTSLLVAFVVTVSIALMSGGTATADRTEASGTTALRQPAAFVVAHNRLGKMTSRVVGTTANGRRVTGKFTPLSFSTANGTASVQGLLNGAVHNASGSTSTFAALRTMTVKTVNGVPAVGGASARSALVASCPILHLVLAPLDLNLLGLKVHLDRVVLNIVAVPGPGNLLGNLLCAVAGLLDGGLGGVLGQLVDLLNQILGTLR